MTFSCSREGDSGATISTDIEVSNFGLYDQNGDFHTLYYHTDAPAIVLFIQGNACPIVRNAVSDYRAVREQFKDQNVRFWMLNANLQDNRENVAQEAKEFDIDFPILIDETQLVAEELQLHRTAEAIVIKPKDWVITYRGPINDRIGYESQRNEAKHHYLADAIKATIKDQPIAEKAIKGKGCLIKLANKDASEFAKISYEKEVAPLLKENCTQCHVKGGIAPWAMDSHAAVEGWSLMIREVLRTRRMPPWQADPHYGVFANDISLTNEEIQTIVHWVEAGAKMGEGEADPLTEVKQEVAEWKLGEPDIVLELAPETIPATGVLDYRYQEFEIEAEKDVWATALQVIPGNTAVLHHLLVSVTYPEGFDIPIAQNSRWLDGLFASWAPGLEPEIFPKGTGRIIPKGSKLVFQLHYTTSGKEEVDQSKLGIYTQNYPPEKEYLIVGPFNPQITIPPNEGDYKAFAKQVFDKEITLYGLGPHMHFRGKSMKYMAQLPDGSMEILLNVPNYNFNWQRYYQLEEPRLLPAGTTILVEAHYDNSALNSFNPDPEKTITWGEQSFDEMLIGYMSFHYGKKEGGELGMNEE